MKSLSFTLAVICAFIVLGLAGYNLYLFWQVADILQVSGFTTELALKIGIWMKNIIYIFIMSMFIHTFLYLGKDE